MLHRFGEAPDRELDFVTLQQQADLVARLAQDAHVQARPLALDFRDGRGHEIGRGAHDRAEHEVAVAAAALDLEPFEHMADLMETNPDGSPRQVGLVPMFHLD